MTSLRKALEKKRDEVIEQWHKNNNWVATERTVIPSQAAFNAATELMLPMIEELRTALEFYANRNHWMSTVNDEGESVNAFFIRPDYGETIKTCGQGARNAISKLEEFEKQVNG